MILLSAAFALTLAAAVPPSGPKPCEELKSDIATKLEAKGVKNYQLEIVRSADLKDQTVVGSCEAGSKKIVYKKDQSAPASHK